MFYSAKLHFAIVAGKGFKVSCRFFYFYEPLGIFNTNVDHSLCTNEFILLSLHYMIQSILTNHFILIPSSIGQYPKHFSSCLSSTSLTPLSFYPLPVHTIR